MSLKYLPLYCALALAAAVCPAQEKDHSRIKKCQDATGRWHYGDTAADACAASKITVINEQGITKKEIAAPPSESDLRAREAELSKRAQAEEQAKQDELLLATYSHEADIIYVRDRKLAQLDATIRASQDTLASLRAALVRTEAQAAEEQKAGKPSEQTAKALEQTRAQIAKHEAAIEAKKQEQQVMRTRAEADLARYRQLKNPARTDQKK